MTQSVRMIGRMEFKLDYEEYIDSVMRGRYLIIMENGEGVALVVPIDQAPKILNKLMFSTYMTTKRFSTEK